MTRYKLNRQQLDQYLKIVRKRNSIANTFCSLLVGGRLSVAESFWVVRVKQMGHIPRWCDLIQCGVAGLWIDRVTCEVLVEREWLGSGP